MYGEEKLNNHNILRYGLTIEFCKNFASLKYKDIEVPMTLIRQFHVFIKPYVDRNLKNIKYIKWLQSKHKIYTISDVQKKLQSYNPKKQLDLSKDPKRKDLLMAGVFAPFALQEFSDSKVILMNGNHYDNDALNGLNIPQNMEVFDLSKQLKETKLSSTTITSYKKLLRKKLIENKKHEIFRTNNFIRWFKKHLIKSLKYIKLLDNLIFNSQVRIILDNIEITTPGNIISLLAVKYNLYYINAPQVLITDRSLVPTRATHYFVWGNNYKKWLRKRNINSTRICITGNLKYEYDKKQHDIISKKDFLKQLNIPEENLIITFTTQTFSQRVNIKILRWIIKALKSLDTVPVTFVIKAHPADNLNYTTFSNKNLIVIPKNMHLYDVLGNTDILMTISSNTAIESAILKKSIFILKPDLPYHYEHNNNDFNLFLIKSKFGVVIKDENDLVSNIDEYINSDSFKKKLIKMSQQGLKDTISDKDTASYIMKRKIEKLLGIKEE